MVKISNYTNANTEDYIPCTLKIKSMYSNFRNSEKAVADYILLNSSEILTKSLAQISKDIGVSEASIIRFCKQIRYSGYSELKMMLAREVGEQSIVPNFDLHDVLIDANEKLEDIPLKIATRTINAIEDIIKIFDNKAYKKAIEVIIKAKRIDIYGVANSASVADDAMNKFLRLGINCSTYADAHLQIVAAASLKKGDVAIGISHSGMTKDTVNAMRLAKKNGATTICITNCNKSVITEVSDIKLLTAFYEAGFNTETTVSRILQLAIIDMLFIGIILHDYEKYTHIISNMNNLLSNMAY